MVRVVTCMMLVLCHGSYGEQAATAQMAQSRLAKTTYATISSNAELSIDPPSTVGVVLVATERCSLLMNGEKVTIDAGDHRRILSRTVVKLAKPGTSSSHVLLIQMATQVQPLTFEKFSLAGHRDLEDGSSRNATMIVALGNIVSEH